MVYTPNTADDLKTMLQTIGVEKFEDLLKSIPASLMSDQVLPLPKALSEMEILNEISDITQTNISNYTSFLGGGSYDHYIPKTVDFIISRSEFYTAYTPYQAEVSQGTLQAMYEFQSMICTLTGMDVSNASMYDGATALAEAAMMARNITRKSKILVSSTVNPSYIKVLKTYAESLGLDIIAIPEKNYVTDIDALKSLINDQTAAVAIQSPNFFGYVEDGEIIAELSHNEKALFIQGTDPISLALLKAPGSYGADIVFAEGQVLGNHQNFGGPYLGIFTTTQKYVRKIPGRIIGATVDKNNKQGFVLTLQTREQHIRREKATSNICSNQGLNALAATIYMALLGKNGLTKVANLSTQKAHYLYENILKIPGFKAVSSESFFKEFLVETPVPAEELVKKLEAKQIFAGIPLTRFYPEKTHQLLIAVTEKRSKKELDEYIEALRSL